MSRRAIIIGAGPAGLTAALELLRHTEVQPIILEQEESVGGISRTVNYHGNRMDIGGHRFFSKSETVMKWWQEILPVKDESVEKTMLVRQRVSRIFYLRRFFSYPISLSVDTLAKLVLGRVWQVGWSYIYCRLFPRRPESNLEDFFINRFGHRLYLTFFKDYTEKVWGVPCNQISAAWGAQRIKGLSITKAILHAFKSLIRRQKKDVAQKDTETSLIERFLYPKYGPGQLWEEVAGQVQAKGGELHLGEKVVRIEVEGKRVIGVRTRTINGEEKEYGADFIFSTMPIKELVPALSTSVPEAVQEVAQGLLYRDFITVGLLVDKLLVKGESGGLIPDNWIYMQEPDVRVGRIQVFNNWSPYLVADPQKVWLGLEYFANEGDEIWNLAESEMKNLAIAELARVGFINPTAVRDSVVIKVPKTYPAYFGAYDRFSVVREYLDSFENLFLIGRNGQHRYNNQDHSMLTAITAVQNVISGEIRKDNIWAVNTEQEYHEEK